MKRRFVYIIKMQCICGVPIDNDYFTIILQDKLMLRSERGKQSSAYI